MAKGTTKAKTAKKPGKAVIPKAAKVVKTKGAKVAKTKQIKRVAPKKVADKKAGKTAKTNSKSAKKVGVPAAKTAKSPAKARKVVVKPTKAPKTKAPAESGPKGYTADQYKKYREEVGRLQKQSNASLKEMLKKNLQSMSGNKDEMIAKIADGIVLGRIPRCPSCFGGRPKFDFKKGTYSCPGYRDDTDFKNCHKTFALNEITRDPWE